MVLVLVLVAAVRMQDKLEVCIKDWAELADEYKQLELAHKEYRNVSPALSLNLDLNHSSLIISGLG